MLGAQHSLVVLGDSLINMYNKKMFYYVYALYNPESDRFYIGYTTDLRRRFKEHQNSKLSHRNKKFKPVFAEAYINKNDADKRESYLKCSKGKFTLKAMLRNTIKEMRC